ncbi:MAG: hypothetical protein JO001_14180 [Alphaproteobacteria bacterium]|nr:hypothetical protein [Alphaproteobacteria bacterium]
MVRDERVTGFPILASPLDIRMHSAIALAQQSRAGISESINHAAGAAGRVLVELGAWAIDVARVIKAKQAIVDAVYRAADERGDLGR